MKIPSLPAYRKQLIIRRAAALCLTLATSLLSVAHAQLIIEDNGDPTVSPYWPSQLFQGLEVDGGGFAGGNGVIYSSNFGPRPGGSVLTNAMEQENGSTATSNASEYPIGFFSGRNFVSMAIANASASSGYYTLAGQGSRTRVQFFTPEAAAQHSVYHWHVSGTQSAPVGQATGRLDFLAGVYGNTSYNYLFQAGNGALSVFGSGDYQYNLNAALNVPIDLFFWCSAFAQVNRGQAPQGGNFTLTANYSSTYELTQIELFDGNNNLIPEWTMTDMSTNRVVFTQNGPVPQCTEPPANLVAWYPGENNARDIQGPTYENGTLQNGTTYGMGMVGQAFSFDGVDDQITVPHDANQNGGSQITIDAWVKPTSSGHWTVDFPKALRVQRGRLHLRDDALAFGT